jgi:hypothetical protein
MSSDPSKTLRLSQQHAASLESPHPMTSEEVEIGVHVEMLHAKEKHPHFPQTPSEQLCIIGEEFGEAMKAVNECNTADYKRELLQVITTCKRALQNVEFFGKNQPDPAPFKGDGNA